MLLSLSLLSYEINILDVSNWGNIRLLSFHSNFFFLIILFDKNKIFFLINKINLE